MDNGFATALRDWLVSEGWDDLFLDVDPERGIAGGERWERSLNQAAHRCEAVLFLVSPAWLASAWCIKEYHLAAKLNKRMFGVLVGDIAIGDLPAELTSTWQVVDLAKGTDHLLFRAALPDGREEHVTFSRAGLARLKAGLTKAGLDPRFFAWPPENDPNRPPYRGLRPLEAEDAGIFFGREAPIIETLDRMRGLRDAAAPRLLVILGASGAGKSSFLRAGLIPRLARDDRNFLVLPIVRPERTVLSGETGLLRSLEEAFAAKGLQRTRAELKKALAAGPEAVLALLAMLAEAAAAPQLDAEVGSRPPTIVLSIDQGEEMFQAESADESEIFLSLLKDLLLAQSQNLIVLVTIRSDSYERLQSAAALEGVHQHTLSLPTLPRGAYQTVIEGPVVRLSGTRRALKVEPQLTQALMADIEAGGGKDSLPLLAFTLERLYLEHGGDGDLKLEEYREIGGIAGSIEAAIARALKAADSDPAVPRDHIARMALLRRAFIPWLAGIDPETGSPRRAIARLGEIPEEARPIVRHLVDQRLLATDISQSGEQVIEPAHEALLRQWGLLHGWLEEDLAQLSALEGVKRATRDWLANARSLEWLAHSAGRLEDAEGLTARPDLAAKLGVAEREYLAICRKAETDRKDRELREAQKLAEAQQQYAEEQRKLAVEQRRTASRTRLGLVAASLLAAVAAGLAYYGLDKANEAELQRAAAQVQQELAEDKSAEAERQTKKAEEFARETEKQKRIAEERAREAVVEATKTKALSQLAEATFSLNDAPRQSLKKASEAIEKLDSLGGSKPGLSDFATVFNVARELPPLEVYESYTVNDLKFFETQDTALQSSVNAASHPLSIIGSEAIVAVVDRDGRPVSPPIGLWEGVLAANGAAWLTSDRFLLATGLWDRQADAPESSPLKAVNAGLRVYDLKGKVTRTLLDGHDVPISSVSVVRRFDETRVVVAGDAAGRLIVASLDGKPPRILPTGVPRAVISVIPFGFEDIAVIFGDGDERANQALEAEHAGASVDEARSRVAQELGLGISNVHFRGTKAGARCAVRLPDDYYAICENDGTVSKWSGYSEDEPDSSFATGQSRVTAIAVLPKSDGIVTASEDGFIRFWSSRGALVSDALPTSDKDDQSIRSLGLLAGGTRLVAGNPSTNPKVWDIADIEGMQQSLQVPQQTDFGIQLATDGIAGDYWLATGKADLSPTLASLLAAGARDQASDVGVLAAVAGDLSDTPQSDPGYSLSADARFLLSFQELPDERQLTDTGLAIADLAAQSPAWAKISDPQIVPFAKPIKGENRRLASPVLSGHVCIVDQTIPEESPMAVPDETTPVEPSNASRETPSRVSLVDLATRSVPRQQSWQDRQISHFTIVMRADGPACVTVGGGSIGFTTAADTKSIEFDLAKLGLPENSEVDEILAPTEEGVVFINVNEGFGDGSTLFKLDARAQTLLPRRLHFSTELSLLAATADGQQLVVALESSGSSGGDDASGVRVLDSNMTTVMFLKQVPREGSYAFSADGNVLRVKEGDVARTVLVGVRPMLELAKVRLLEWSRRETRETLNSQSGSCIEAKQWPRCREILRAALRRFPRDASFLLRRANASERSTADEVRATLAMYDRALAEDPYSYTGRYMRGMLHLNSGDFPAALADFSAMLALPSPIPDFPRRGAWGVADPIVQAVRQSTAQIKKAQLGDLYRHRAYVFTRMGDWDSALRDMAQVRARTAVTALDLEVEGAAYVAAGKAAEALASYQQALAAFRNDPERLRLDEDEAVVKTKAFQHWKAADLLMAIAETSALVGQAGESSHAAEEARQSLLQARQSADISESVSEAVAAAERRLGSQP